ncbi:MAG: AMP-binding protein [Mojavia pulchra JT2-VF2]|jgi:long-chain acyl-CoA synthetase|uniref:AMP-binding protein n=1 Tax=Mojavia pulchra JT2-VF2 TaxID=287848 RepID=A0A951UFN3_9NOST|nr:AMP-binding protein [Mojavia pulchra JT2-VF2]
MLSSNKIYRAPANSGEVILGRTLPSLLDEACSRSPNSQALNQYTETGWQPLSNQEFRNTAAELALGLLNLQLETGDRIALLMHSDVNFCIADMGSLLAGLVNVPIDLSQTIEHIIFILQHTEAKVLIIADLDLFAQIIPYLKNLSHLQTVIVADVPNDWHERRQQIICQHNVENGTTLKDEDNQLPDYLCLCLPKFLLSKQNEQSVIDIFQCIQVFSLEEIRLQGRTENLADRLQQLTSKLVATDLATIIYIPGITGEPQGVMLTHENLSANALAMFTGIPDLKFGTQEVVLTFLPLTHVFSRVFFYGHLNYGHSIYFSNSNRVLKHLKEVKPTIFATVPLLLEKVYGKLLEEEGKNQTRGNLPRRFSLHLSQSIMIWALKIAQKYELGKTSRGKYTLMLMLANRLVFSKWRSVFGGKVKYLISGGAALKSEIVNLFAAARITILQGYGLTETSSGLACNRSKFNRAGTVGLPIAGVEIAIAEDGEILTKSPYITQGYYKNPAATQQLIDSEGWLHTGDLGEFTTDGFLKITGLKKSRFKLSTGKYVTSQPIESKLKKSPLVAHAVTVGAECKFCAMLIFPHLENLRQQALSIGIDLPIEALLQHPCIVALYQALVDEANCHLPHWSTVKRFQLINANLTVENGMLTSTQEVNRATIVEVFAQEIAAIYEEKGLQRRGKAKIEKIDDLCPFIPAVSCPAYAQSLNS